MLIEEMSSEINEWYKSNDNNNNKHNFTKDIAVAEVHMVFSAGEQNLITPHEHDTESWRESANSKCERPAEYDAGWQLRRQQHRPLGNALPDWWKPAQITQNRRSYVPVPATIRHFDTWSYCSRADCC